MSKLLPLYEVLAKCRRGILFSGPLVPTVLDGRKTVTRRLDRRWLKYPAGTLLYVCETIRLSARAPVSAGYDLAVFAADGEPTKLDTWPWQRSVLPSIHMPRGLTRCVLRLTEDPRLERLHDITDDDAKREGVPLPVGVPECPCEGPDEEPGPHLPTCLWRNPDVDPHESGPHVAAFACTWFDLHKKPGERWEDNPEIVRITFARIA